MIKRDSLFLFSCLPLLVVMFWQGSSCNSTKTSKNSTRNDNHSVNANNTPRQSPALKGAWGAQGISMTVTDNGAEITYDCAHGSITEKIVLDGQGHFSARGRHVRQHPGPTRDGEEEKGQPATYRGSISGDTMNLTVTLSGSEEAVGTFALIRGKAGRLRRCL